MSIKKEIWMVAAIDAITQFRATGEPLKNVAKRLGQQRRLGPKERALMTQMVFSWLRIEKANQDKARMLLKERGLARPTQRQIDEVILEQLQAGETLAKNELPQWFAHKLQKAYPEQYAALAEAFQLRAGPTLAVDTRHVSTSAVSQHLVKLGVAHKMGTHVKDAIQISGAFRMAALPPSIAAHVWLMDEASQLAAQTVEPKEGSLVLDYCAGGGGKTRFLLSRGAHVIAMDVSEKRIQSAKERVPQKESVSFIVADGGKPPFKDASFDSILVDAPCTGTGTIRRAPDLLSRLNESDLKTYVDLQRLLLSAAFKLLAPAGRLIYSTCSLLAEENEEQVTWMTQTLGASVSTSKQLLPSQDETDGFFIAEIRKPGE